MKSIIKAAYCGKPEVKQNGGRRIPLSDAEKEEIKRLKGLGLYDREVAKQIGRSTYSVGRVKRNSKKQPVKEGFFNPDEPIF